MHSLKALYFTAVVSFDLIGDLLYNFKHSFELTTRVVTKFHDKKGKAVDIDICIRVIIETHDSVKKIPKVRKG
jgi:hypothetical protein